MNTENEITGQPSSIESGLHFYRHQFVDKETKQRYYFVAKEIKP
ncbi:hypothetical protein N0M98_10475 [Paenibacillus doosanensis]|nr:hypothetical protein [Paenibacillus konkukensis]MCS7460565.1 hypothetical protein [Paenibacillus doosanensis]